MAPRNNPKPILSALGGDILARANRIKFQWKQGQFKRLCLETDLTDLASLCAFSKHASDDEFKERLIKSLKELDEPRKEKEEEEEEDGYPRLL